MKSSKIGVILLLIIFLTGCGNKTYMVSFNTLGGSVMESIYVNEGEILKDIAKPLKDGYLFVNWLKDGVEYNFDKPINEDITLTASWIETPEIYNYYKVTFSFGGESEVTTVREGELVTSLKIPDVKNYLFLGWYLNDSKFDFNTPINEDITLVAKYELNVVTVTYDLNGGFGLAMETIPKYSKLFIPDMPVREGYKFLKWTLNGREFSFDTVIEEDIILKAEWAKVEYVTIKFDTDGGDLINDLTIDKYSKLDGLPIAIKEGYRFLKWTLDGEDFTAGEPINSDITLKAIYELDNN